MADPREYREESDSLFESVSGSLSLTGRKAASGNIKGAVIFLLGSDLASASCRATSGRWATARSEGLLDFRTPNDGLFIGECEEGSDPFPVERMTLVDRLGSAETSCSGAAERVEVRGSEGEVGSGELGEGDLSIELSMQ